MKVSAFLVVIALAVLHVGASSEHAPSSLMARHSRFASRDVSEPKSMLRRRNPADEGSVCSTDTNLLVN